MKRTSHEPRRSVASRPTPSAPNSATRLCARLGALPLTFVVVLALAACAGDEVTQSCTRTIDCETGTVCQDRSCVRATCTASTDCPSDATCKPNGICGHVECERDAQCDDDLVCADGLCGPETCERREQCGLGQRCVRGVCRSAEPGGECTDEADCPRPQRCAAVDGLCVDPCVDDSDCSAEDTICDPGTGACVAVECTASEDCARGHSCARGRCVEQLEDCDTIMCGQGTPFVESVPGGCRCVACVEDRQCAVADDERCVGDPGICSLCVEGDDAASCPEERPIAQEGCCVQCIEPPDCRALGFGIGVGCFRGRCIACNCRGGCACPEGNECRTLPGTFNGVGECVPEPARAGDPCAAQADCGEVEAGLGCDYRAEVCKELTSGGACRAGCPEPSRCIDIGLPPGAGGECHGCTPGAEPPECPSGQRCVDAPDLDGGRCFPS